MLLVSILVACLSLAVGVFAHMVGRRPGERRDIMPSSLLIIASMYALVDGAGYVPDIAPKVRTVLASLTMALAGLFVILAVRHIARIGRSQADWTYKAMQAVLGASVVVSLVPGWTYAPDVNARAIPLVHATYFELAPTVFGYLVFGVAFGTLLLILGRAIMDWRRGVPLAGYSAVAFAVLFLCAGSDLIVTLDASPLPYLLPEGVFLAALAFSAGLVRQIVDDRVALDRLRVELEARVEERTRELEQSTSELARAERLATVGRLAAGIAHALNNPTAAIKASLDDARSELSRRGGMVEVGACVDISLTAVDRVTRIVRQLGAMAGGADLAARTSGGGTSLAIAVKAAVSSARDAARPDITLAVAVDPTLWVRGMATALEEAISAIIRNAVEAVPDGRPGMVDVSAAVVDGHVVLTVRDNGAGMAADVAAHAFEPFYSTKRAGRSSGLGLPVAKGLLETMGGALSLRSIPGVGTEVTLRLLMGEASEISTPRRVPPDLRTPTSVPAQPTQPAQPAHRPRVLLVDDDDLVVVAMRRFLAQHYVVETAATVAEGLAKASLAFDVILSDVVMPDGGGPRLYTELLARNPALADRVIFMTGGAFRSEIQEFLQNQEQVVLNKPVRLSELQAAVTRLMAATAV